MRHLNRLFHTVKLTNSNRLPMKNGLLDWDCAGAIDVPGMAKSLAFIREHGSFPVRPDDLER